MIPLRYTATCVYIIIVIICIVSFIAARESKSIAGAILYCRFRTARLAAAAVPLAAVVLFDDERPVEHLS